MIAASGIPKTRGNAIFEMLIESLVAEEETRIIKKMSKAIKAMSII